MAAYGTIADILSKYHCESTTTLPYRVIKCHAEGCVEVCCFYYIIIIVVVVVVVP
jgi:hypothetical protein